MAPDMGAYEFGANDYWMLVEKRLGLLNLFHLKGLRNVKSSAALMWRKALSSSNESLVFGK